MSEIKVLHVFHQMDVGGAEILFLNILNKTNRDKFQLDVLTHTEKKGYFDDELIDKGIKILHIQNYNETNIIKYVKDLMIILNDNNYDIVHIHKTSVSSIVAFISRIKGIKVVMHSHAARENSFFNKIIYKLATVPNRWYSDYFLSCSDKAALYRFGKRISKNNEKHSYIKNGIDTEKFKFNNKIRFEMRDSLGIKENELIVGNISRFSEVKNHKKILEVFHEIKKIYPHSKLMLVGDGELKENIIKYATDLEILDFIIFTGVQKNVNDYLQAIDIILFPSFFEGLPLSLIEAQASGLPCYISSNISKDVDITDLIFRINIEAASSEIATQMINHYNKHKSRKSYNNIVKNAGYDISESAERVFSIYQSILADK